ncbi:copper homeostasis periplasmic binding protein CopC [Novosphingobium album (ex Hu et al. 2023)]|uniref:Copper homeostasis periplasmic binding protein CopC n=1 Tax=Novosphingobium album (ex Hu et al. 2023) TaxID=2930093 RepID=A0ABT0B7S7_9SPHN|nr:copper homeostasis periplasmic binding protein CopC [Novosphingobium album (ex Hu et al. 2023)]MCJ2180931.1 copper homeostasis periplasmic binding protein CopC [Novosphingobium album (ex Hu et al. 2023)]
MSRITFPRLLPLAAILPFLAASPALAHPKLLSSTPAADSSVSKPATIVLNFSETLVGPLSGIDLVMTGMPGMANHKPMPIKGFTANADGKTLKVALPRPLPAGSYALSWHAVAADQHRIEGSFTFTVK